MLLLIFGKVLKWNFYILTSSEKIKIWSSFVLKDEPSLLENLLSVAILWLP